MKAKSKPEHRKKNPARGARETTLVPHEKVSFPVIAMAASVGGLKALSAILGGLPADFPAAIAIVMHLAPNHNALRSEPIEFPSSFAAQLPDGTEPPPAPKTHSSLQTLADQLVLERYSPAAVLVNDNGNIL
jgi:CheB methylesterase